MSLNFEPRPGLPREFQAIINAEENWWVRLNRVNADGYSTKYEIVLVLGHNEVHLGFVGGSIMEAMKAASTRIWSLTDTLRLAVAKDECAQCDYPRSEHSPMGHAFILKHP